MKELDRSEWVTLKTWIESQSSQTRSKIAARAALRAFPLVKDHRVQNEEMDRFDLLVARALLATVVSSNEQSPQISAKAIAAANLAKAAIEVNPDVVPSIVALCVISAALLMSQATQDNTKTTIEAVSRSMNARDRYSTRHGEGELAREVTLAISVKDTKVSADELFSTPLWYDYDSKHVKKAVSGQFQYSPYQTMEDHFSPFWLEWYQGFLDGKPLDWELQKEIALIPDADWEKGPEWIAEKIEIIRKRRELEAEIAKLKEQLDLAQSTATLPNRLHNQPPEAVDDAAQVFKREITVVWGEIDALEKEISKPDPSPTTLTKIATRLKNIAISIAKYCGEVADTTIKAGAKKVGTVGATVLLANAVLPGSIQNVVQAIWGFVKILGG